MQQNTFATHENSSASRGQAASSPHLAEIWGDVVDVRHLATAVVIAAIISVGTFLIASNLFASLVAVKDVGRAYAMLAGLAGCVISGVVCARLFSPKRVVIDGGTDEQWRSAAIDELVKETGSIGITAELPQAVVDEMKELGLYAAFASHDTPQLIKKEA